MKLKDDQQQSDYKRPETYGRRDNDLTRQRKELWLYTGVAIAALVCLITVAAVSYGFITAGTGPGGETRINFPLLSWVAGLVLLPTALVLAVHYAGVGLFERTPRTADEEAEWQARLPERFQRVYRFLKGAPVAVVLLALIIAGVTLATIDGALSAFVRVAAVFAPYIPHIVISLAAVVCCFLVVAAWFKFRTRKMEAEMAFRRDVFERTGMLIVDKNHIALPPGGTPGGEVQALPPAVGHVLDAEVVEAGQAALPAGEEKTTGQHGSQHSGEPPAA